MTPAKRLSDVATLLYGCATLLYLWRPSYYRVFIGAAVVFVAAMLYSALQESAVDRERNRRVAAWLIPLSTLLVGAQMVYSAAPEFRWRTTALAAGLVTAGLALVWARRRAT